MQNNNGSRVIPTTVFLLYRKLLVSYKVKNAPRGCASRGEEVSCKQHRSSAKESQVTLCYIIGLRCQWILALGSITNRGGEAW